MKSIKNCIAELIDEEILSHLHTNETNAEFVERVCQLYLEEIENTLGYTPKGYGADVIEEIELAAMEVFRVKIYGYYDLHEYRQAQLKKRIG